MERLFIYGLISFITFCNVVFAAPTIQTLYDYRQQSAVADILQMQDYHLQQAQQKIEHDQLAYAWGDLAYILCYIPNHHIVLKQMLEIAIKINKQDEMQKFFDKAINEFPEDGKVYSLYANFLDKIGDVESAKKYQELAVEFEQTS